MKGIYVGGIWGDMCIKMREDFALEEKLFWDLNVNFIWVGNS